MKYNHVHLGIVFGIVGLLLAACTTPAATPATQNAPASSEKTITMVIPEDPPSFNATIGDTGYDALVMHLVMLGMVGVDPQGKIYPQLAAELPTQQNGAVVIDPATGSMDVTWKMRPDITWSDGTPLTADDVLFTYQAITNPQTGFWVPGIDLVTGVDKIDPHSFVVHFSSVYPSYLTLFGGRQVVIWPAHYCKADQGFQQWDCGRKPLSSGPFLLDEWVTGDHMLFSRNPAYYQPGKPAIDSVIVKIVPDETVRETMLRKGDADILMWANEQVTDNLKDATNVKVSISPTSRFVMRLYPNLAAKGTTDPEASPSPFFADVRVRQAIRAAIDVDKISSSVWHGFAKPVWTEFFRPPYDKCSIPRPAFDPQAARTLLDQAGWTDSDGDGTRECHGCANGTEGQPFKFELFIYSEYGEPLNLTQQLIGEMLKDVGIQAELVQTQGSIMWADSASGGMEQSGNFEVDLYDDGYAGSDPTDFLWQYYASSSAQPDGGVNVGRWKNKQMDDLLSQAYTLDETARQAAFCQMAQLLDQQLPEILLFSTINADAYSARMDGIQANVNDVVTWNVADWQIK